MSLWDREMPRFVWSASFYGSKRKTVLQQTTGLLHSSFLFTFSGCNPRFLLFRCGTTWVFLDAAKSWGCVRNPFSFVFHPRIRNHILFMRLMCLSLAGAGSYWTNRRAWAKFGEVLLSCRQFVPGLIRVSYVCAICWSLWRNNGKGANFAPAQVRPRRQMHSRFWSKRTVGWKSLSWEYSVNDPCLNFSNLVLCLIYVAGVKTGWKTWAVISSDRKNDFTKSLAYSKTVLHSSVVLAVGEAVISS